MDTEVESLQYTWNRWKATHIQYILRYVATKRLPFLSLCGIKKSIKVLRSLGTRSCSAGSNLRIVLQNHIHVDIHGIINGQKKIQIGKKIRFKLATTCVIGLLVRLLACNFVVHGQPTKIPISTSCQRLIFLRSRKGFVYWPSYLNILLCPRFHRRPG